MKRLKARMEAEKVEGVQIQPERSKHYKTRSPHSFSSKSELANMLECPVCLETASTPPIYQCEAGHLLCKVGIFNLDT